MGFGMVSALAVCVWRAAGIPTAVRRQAFWMGVAFAANSGPRVLINTFSIWSKWAFDLAPAYLCCVCYVVVVKDVKMSSRLLTAAANGTYKLDSDPGVTVG